MNVGLLGGTFDPVHVAHLRAAEEIREQCGLDRIEFVLAALPPHKDAAMVTPAAHRRRMLELAVAGHPPFAVNTIEIERPGRSYSIDTVRTCAAARPEARFTFIMGADAFADVESWKEAPELFALCDVRVMTRPGATIDEPPIAVAGSFCYDPSRRVYAHQSGHSLAFVPVTPLMISASDIRERCRTGRSIRYLVPAAVETYIREHGLYAGRPAAH